MKCEVWDVERAWGWGSGFRAPRAAIALRPQLPGLRGWGYGLNVWGLMVGFGVWGFLDMVLVLRVWVLRFQFGDWGFGG